MIEDPSTALVIEFLKGKGFTLLLGEPLSISIWSNDIGVVLSLDGTREPQPLAILQQDWGKLSDDGWLFAELQEFLMRQPPRA